MKFRKTAAVLMATVMTASVFSACDSSNLSNTVSGNTLADGTSISETSASSLASLRSLINTEYTDTPYYAGVAFLGYVNDNNSTDQISDYISSSTASTIYPFLKDIPKSNYVSTGGAELYAIVPKNDEISISVYKSDLTSNGKFKAEETPMYEGEPGEIVILCCNISEIYSDAFVSASNSKNKRSFWPSVSLENGQLTSYKGFFDFSCYDNVEIKNDVDIQNGYSALTSFNDVRELTDSGYALIYQDKIEQINGSNCMIYSIGTYFDEEFIPEIDYAVCGDKAFMYNDGNWLELTKN